MAGREMTDEMARLLEEAAQEIARLDGRDNDVCKRLRIMQRRIAPQTATIGEIARRLDISPGDVLDAALAVGIRPFWHEGQQFRDPAYLKTYLRLRFFGDPVPELRFTLAPENAELLAEELGVAAEELWASEGSDAASAAGGRKAPRKFVPSEGRMPETDVGRARERQA